METAEITLLSPLAERVVIFPVVILLYWKLTELDEREVLKVQRLA
jgi:hypothetical protein